MDADGAGTDVARTSLEKALGSHYRILRLLGRGGMGTVYLARDEALERLVAIKVLRPELAPAEGRERFRREARTAAQLTHPNIVPLLSFGEVDGMMYLVLGYVRGEPLSARLKRDGRLGPDEARRIVADIAEGLDYAHRKGVVHRDVKPDNILLDDETGHAVLTDFGIAKALGAGQTMTQAGQIVGTPHYMSPEQVAGQETVDGRSDIYSLGLVAYAMLSGRLPFEGGAPQDVLVRRLTQEAPPLAEIAREVPEDLAAVVARCLRRDREARWPDARSLREATAPTSLEAEQLPEPLDSLDGAGPLLLPFALVLADALLAAFLAAGPIGLWLFVIAVAGGLLAIQVPMLSSAVRAARGRGFTSRQIAGAFLRQPEWWACLWYPRRLRRGGDVWHRLPRPFRAYRIIATALMADVLVALPFFTAVASERTPALLAAAKLPMWPLVTWPLVALWMSFPLLALAMGVAAFFCARVMRRRGLDTYTLRRTSWTLLVGPTARRALWKKPEVAAVLLPAAGASTPATQPRAPRDFLHAVSEAARGLTGPAQAAAGEAGDAIRHLIALIEAQDGEIARLAREADPTEGARLRERLASLEGTDDGEGRQMRELLAQQLALLERIGARLEAARARRERLIAALEALWHAVRELSAGEAATETARRVRTLCAEIQALAPPEAGLRSEERTATRPR